VRLRQSKGTRVRAGFRPAPLAFLRTPLVSMTLATAACLLAAGCSPGSPAADYPPFPSIFPAAHDAPPPRADTTMNPVEVQKATEDLITDRDRLNAQAPSSQGQSTGQAAAGQTGPKIAAKTATKAKKASKSAPQQTAAVPPATTASVQGAGAQAAGSDPKP
jgi:hypothetical protein